MSPTNSDMASDEKLEAVDEIPTLSKTSTEEETKMTFRKVNFKDDSANNNVTVKSEDESRTNGESDFDLAKYEAMEFKALYRWPDSTVQLLLHLGMFYGFYLILTLQVKFWTVLFALLTIYISGFGITAGAHRLWSHRAYRARAPLRVLLALLFSITGQRDVYTWALDHRVHHKYTETVADPHDARRGFWFSHVGWLVLTPHPAVEDRRRAFRISSVDLMADPVVKLQRILNVPLFGLLNIGIPVFIPVYFWQEDLITSFFVSFVMRFTMTLNIAFCVNSVAHIWGNKPYDRFIRPVENKIVSLMAMGEGWHNYHHVFPWDYKTSELGRVNPSTGFIDFFARIGWAYDRKSASDELVELRSQRSGDGTRRLEHEHGGGLWGFGDPDMPAYEQRLIAAPSATT